MNKLKEEGGKISKEDNLGSQGGNINEDGKKPQ
jgi:hypothetical protein